MSFYDPETAALFEGKTFDFKTNGHSAQSAQNAPCTKEESEYLASPSVPWVPFPTQLLPPVVAEYVKASAAALGCDEAMVAVPTLPIMAAAIGNSFRLQVKRSWYEPSTIWAVVINRSGTLKSPALEKALFPVNALELDLKDDYEGRIALYEREMERGEEEPDKPVRQRLRVSDTTVESIALVHSGNPRGLLLARDELAGWLGGFDRYSKGEADMQSWIEMYDGRFVQIDRKTTTPPVLDIRYPAVSVVGTSQPKVFFEDRISRAHFESGFISRWIIVYPPERPRRWTDSDIHPDAKRLYSELVSSLYNLPFQGEPCFIELSPEAKDVFTDFYNSNAGLVSTLPEGALRSSLSKIEAIAARLALIFHLADHPVSIPGPVKGETMQRAVWLAQWVRYELARIYENEGLHERSISRDEKLAGDLPSEFTWEDVSVLWEVKRRAAFKVIKRLIEKGLADDAGHGKYAKGTVHFGHSVHFDPPDIPDEMQSTNGMSELDEVPF